MIKRIVLAIALLVAGFAPAFAQFADQATYAGTGAGSANAQTIALANVTSYADVTGVIIKYIPAATNTGAATLGITGVVGTLPLRKPSGAGVTALTGSEIVTGRPTYVMSDGTFFNLVSPTSLPIGAAQLQTSAASFGAPVNLQLNASVGSNQITVAIKGNNGSDPSATNPVIIPFRDATIANGDPVVLSLTSALSITVNSTNTLGCVSAQMCRLWVVAFNNGGSIAIGLFNALSGTNIAPINEAVLQSSASGTTGGSLAQTYYASTSSITSKAIRILGYIDIQEVTAGTWALGPTYVQLFGPGIKKPGDIVQISRVNSGGVVTIAQTSLIPNDNTIPQITEGDEWTTLAVTPTSAANVLRVKSSLYISTDGNVASDTMAIALFQDATANALTASRSPINVSKLGSLSLDYFAKSLTTSSTTFRIRYGSAGNSNLTINGIGGVGTFGGVLNSFIEVQEIMGSLPEPANNNWTPISAVG